MMTEPADNIDKKGAGAIPVYRTLCDYQMEFWSAFWQWPFAAMKFWMSTGKNPDAGKETPEEEREPTEKEIDEALEESFPASDPPSFNPGEA